jgi:hypothetical protein
MNGEQGHVVALPRNCHKRLRDMDSLICQEMADWLEKVEAAQHHSGDDHQVGAEADKRATPGDVWSAQDRWREAGADASVFDDATEDDYIDLISDAAAERAIADFKERSALQSTNPVDQQEGRVEYRTIREDGLAGSAFEDRRRVEELARERGEEDGRAYGIQSRTVTESDWKDVADE